MDEPPVDWDQRIKALVLDPDYEPAKASAIARRLSASAEEVPLVRKAVQRLVKRGELAYGAKHFVKAPGVASRKRAGDSLVTGVFRRNPKGFGFVRPSGHRDAAGTDWYISAADSLDASTGDLVLVRPYAHGRQGAGQGKIVEILERDTHRFVGSYFERGGEGWVQVDGKLFAKPISVGDPGAKNARPNDKVVVELMRFPSHVHDGEGVLIEVLGPRGMPGVDTLSIIREFELPEDFSPEAQAAARAAAERFVEEVPPDRTDFTTQTVITIDPVDARDFDDAISLVRLENGHWLLGVHIADVAHFVKRGSALDREAYERATSVYLPDRVLPMLPEIVSNGLASLQPDRLRFVVSALLEFTAVGTPVDVELHLGVIQSRRRFSYEEVDDYLAHPAKWKKRLPAEVFDLLGRMAALAKILRARRKSRGSLELSMPEVKIDLDPDGRVCGAHPVEHTFSHQIIEEFMLSANEAVARRLTDLDLGFLRRVHHPPDPLKIQALQEFVAGLGYQTDGLESRFELQSLLARSAARPERYAVHYAALRSLARAVYSPESAGHFALASDCYCHFTSPIRRYPDLTVHRLVTDLVRGKKPRHSEDELAAVGEHCSERERRAETAERELVRIKLLDYLSQRIGDEMDAVITGVEEFGLFAQGTALPAEGLIHVSSLSDDYYHFERRTHSLSGRRSGNQFRLGDQVRVVVARVDVNRRELDFRLADRAPRRPRVAKPKKPGPGRPRRTKQGTPDETPPRRKSKRSGGRRRASS